MIMHLEQEAPLERESLVIRSDNDDVYKSKYSFVARFFQKYIYIYQKKN